MEVKVININDDIWDDIIQRLPHDIYHLRKYLALEGQRIGAIAEAVYIERDRQIFFLPYLIRSCQSLLEIETDKHDSLDIISPYGYPGPLLNCDVTENSEFLRLAFNTILEYWQSLNVCSAFLRLHPILNQQWQDILPEICQVAGQTVSVDLTLSTEEIWQGTKSEHRNKINRCKRRGFLAKIVDLRDGIEDFKLVYQETMDRVSANSLYYFDDAYYQSLCNLNPHVHLCLVEQASQVAAAGIFTECSGIVQYHLGGTKREFLSEAPSKLMFDSVRFWAKDRGNKLLHLGGGLGGSQDSLYKFKAGFSKLSYPFSTMKIIVNKELYSLMVVARATQLNTDPENINNSNFFPAYRLTSLSS